MEERWYSSKYCLKIFISITAAIITMHMQREWFSVNSMNTKNMISPLRIEVDIFEGETIRIPIRVSAFLSKMKSCNWNWSPKFVFFSRFLCIISYESFNSTSEARYLFHYAGEWWSWNSILNPDYLFPNI